MLLSEILNQKAIEDDCPELQKFASAIQFTDDDKEILEKDASMWGSAGKALMAGAKGLMSSTVVRNAAVGAGVGAVGGAINAEPGSRLAGAAKGGLIGGAIAGAGTLGSNVIKSTSSGMGLRAAVRQEGGLIASAGRKAVLGGKEAYQIGQGTKAAVAASPKGMYNPADIPVKPPTPFPATKVLPVPPPLPNTGTPGSIAGQTPTNTIGSRPGFISGFVQKVKSKVTGVPIPYSNRA